jgi:hypothetical protein
VAAQEPLSAVPLAVVADICTNTLKITVNNTNHIITKNHIISTTTTTNRHGLEQRLANQTLNRRSTLSTIFRFGNERR